MKYFAETVLDERKIAVLINVVGFKSDEKLKKLIVERGDELFQSISRYVGWLKP